ncbi:mortality factor 4-like protein 1 isoform X1 [Neodiprion virginianus]|uniref:mortality factor 4-like protein 1 isoform X1 n=1 Tax=Neodiprion fabricii TaxID=2872261 RepID=UPI001ED972B5|nr:mortality factor 4-like protein 1 isoform X1 [Neodiprion fabricii]XP_046431164.1 mortality factor 4-like protein 1 isoform X1 [Neodiprion fabricii]XP_046431165.1 mortality factor 4-like protein 1 isoform X1 [Neodiprion fabricii]XP_046624931.1 mortality factor 4-like protein 1 isoform X1 [Neodiprion virginianus]XP_046624932.1 mortality factor 4-like protein 1 isoform X1 [Neodiprion virginianus]
MPPKCKFQEGEKVLCFHGPLIYEAKCLKSSVTKEKQIKYLIHYAGWNKNWDEWVPESRVLKYNESNVQKQREVQRAHSTQQPSHKGKKTGTTTKAQGRRSESGRDKDSESRASTPVGIAEKTGGRSTKGLGGGATPSSSHDSSSDAPRKKRSRVDPSVETEEQFLTKVEVKVKMPDELKPWLVDDWDAISRQRKLAILPARNTVDRILDDYVKFKTSSKTNNPNKESAVLEVTKGVREYFNVMLGTQLLYRWERQQYSEVMTENPDSTPSQIYGAFHLLRLFVKLGSMLSYTPLDERSIQLLLAHIHDFLRYLHKNSSDLFSLQDYGAAPPEYHRKCN